MAGRRCPRGAVRDGIPGRRRCAGCSAATPRTWRRSDGWGRLVAASDLAAIAYVNEEPVAGRRGRSWRHVRGERARAAVSTPRRIGVWACSGNVPNALSLLMEASPRLACAALCYGYMLDLDGQGTAVADGSRAWRFVNPCAGRALEAVPGDVPLFLARAGCDETAGLNDSIDRFVSKALGLNRPVTLVNHHTAPHAFFDTADDSDASRAVIRQLLVFLRGILVQHGLKSCAMVSQTITLTPVEQELSSARRHVTPATRAGA